VSQTEITGITYTVVHGTYTLEGILSVNLTQTGGPAVESLDVTVYNDGAYTYIPHPLGAKGSPKVKLTVVVQASTNAYADSKATKIPFNVNAATVWCMQPGTANTNEFTDSMQLTERTTEIPFAALATTTLVFEANGTGAWDSPA
jgi:hypothetical protein